MKRIVLCFGGTWNRPERSGMVEGGDSGEFN
jgi:hypothetical protein